MADIIYPEPTWTTPQNTVCSISYLRDFGVTPYILMGVFLRLLQYHFSSVANISSPYLANSIWSEDEETSKLVIKTGSVTNGNNVSQIPAIYVGMTSVRATKMGVLVGDSTPLARSSNGYLNKRDHHKMLAGGARILCISKSQDEAFLMAEEIFYRMMTYAPKIRDDIGVGAFNVSEFSPAKPTRIYGGEEVFFASVVLKWDNLHKWSLVAEAPSIKRLHMQHTTNI